METDSSPRIIAPARRAGGVGLGRAWTMIADHPFPDHKRLLVRLGGLRPITTVEQAYGLLLDWPEEDRGMRFGFAHRMLVAALSGKASSDDAYEATKALCEGAGILVARPTARWD